MNTGDRMTTRGTYVPKNKSYSKETKESTLERIELGIWTPAQARTQLKCSPQTIYNWMGAKENKKELHDYSHRPTYLSTTDKQELVDEAKKESENGRAVSKRKFGENIQNRVNQTRISENKPPVVVSSRFVRDFIHKENLHTGNAEIESNSHEVAAKDPRHAASFAAMIHFLHTIVPEDQFINLDKTSFDWLNGDQETEPGVFVGKRKQSLKVSASKSPKVKGNCSIPVYIVASSGGCIGDVVYLIKDRDMKPGEIDVYTAPMLTAGNSATATSHIIFTGESTTNHDEALKWVLEHVVVPFGELLRSAKDKDPNSSISLTVDGDPRQLQVLAEEHTRGLLTQARFIVGKSPASCTPIYQPLDAGKLFLAAKTRFRRIMDEGTTNLSERQSADLKSIFQQHRQRHPAKLKKGGAPSIALSPYLNNVLKCLPAVACALADVPIRRVVKNSFEIAGVSPFSAEAVRKKCRYDWTKAQEDQFDRAVPDLSRRFAENKELKESDFNDLHIPANNKPKDEVAVHMRRALLLYAPHVLEALQEQAGKSKKK